VSTAHTANAVTVVCARLPQPLPEAHRSALRAQLSYARRLHLSAAPQRQSHSLLGVALACELLSRLARRPLRPAQLRYTAHGKPFAPGFPAFSISHSGAWVVCAAASAGAIGALPGALAAWCAREATLKAAGARLHELPHVYGSGGRLQFQGRRWYGRAPRLGPDTVLRVVSSRPITQFRLERRPALRVVAWQELRS